MKVIDLLEKVDIDELEFIDIYTEDEIALCTVSCPDRWRGFLTEKVLNSEVFKFSPNDTSSEPGLNIYIKDEETCNDIYKDKFEKKHVDSLDSLIFAKKELDKVIITRKSLVDEIHEIVKDDPNVVIQVAFGSYKDCVMVNSDKFSDFKSLLPDSSEKNILNTIKYLIESNKTGLNSIEIRR